MASASREELELERQRLELERQRFEEIRRRDEELRRCQPFRDRLTAMRVRSDELKAIDPQAVAAAVECKQESGGDLGEQISKGAAEGFCKGTVRGVNTMFGTESDKQKFDAVYDAYQGLAKQMANVRDQMQNEGCNE